MKTFKQLAVMFLLVLAGYLAASNWEEPAPAAPNPAPPAVTPVVGPPPGHSVNVSAPVFNRCGPACQCGSECGCKLGGECPGTAKPKATPPEYVTVAMPYTQTVFGRRGRPRGTQTVYRNVTMTAAQYEALKSRAATGNRTYSYGGIGCASGRCGR